MEVDVRVDTSQLESRIRRFQARTKNLPMDLIGQLFVNESEEMFETEGASGEDGPWAPLAESTIARQPRRAGGLILQDTGVTANVQVMEVGEFSVTIGSPSEWSGFHIDGTADMPQRDFFAFRFSKVLDEAGDLVLQGYART